MDDFDLDALLDDTLEDFDNGKLDTNTPKVNTDNAKIQICGCTNPQVQSLDGIYSKAEPINGHDSFAKDDVVLWFHSPDRGWAISLKEYVQSDTVKARCVQNRQHPWELNKVWDVFTGDAFVAVDTMKVQRHSDCPVDQAMLQDLFQDIGVNLDKDFVIEDAADIFASDAAQSDNLGDLNMNENDIMSMLGQMGNMGLGSEGDFEGMMADMMKLMLKKDILYEPIQLMNRKFPQWLEQNKGTLSDEEYGLYEQQYTCTQEIETLMGASEDPDMQVVLAKFNNMMEICSFPQALLQEVFQEMDVDLGDMENIGGAAANMFGDLSGSEQDAMSQLLQNLPGAAPGDEESLPSECQPQ